MLRRRYRGQEGGGGGLTLPTYPEPISNVVATQTDINSATLTWDLANVPATATNIVIYQDGVEIANLAPTTTTFTVTTLVVGTPSVLDIVVQFPSGSSSLGKSITVTTQYMYGYPFAATRAAEPNVICQFVCQEASGNMVDEVAGLTLEPVLGAAGQILYGIDGAPYSPLFGDSIYIASASSGQAAYFRNNADTSISFGTGSGVIEYVTEFLTPVLLHTVSGGTATLFSTTDSSITNGVYIYYEGLSGGSKTFNVYIKASDGTLLSGSITLLAPVFGYGTFKHRVVLDRAGNLSYYINKVLQGTISMAGLSGKTIPASQFILFGVLDGGLNRMNGLLRELRITAGNVTNDSGGPDDN